MKQKRKTIGIIGGMGPGASAYMYKLLIEFSIKYFAARNNDNFPQIVLYSIPVPDFISNKKNQKVALRMLKDSVIKLNQIDVSFLAIACNTAHILLPDLKEFSKASFISMIDEVVKKVRQSKIKKVGILGTPSTINSKLYQKALAEYKIESVIPNNKQQAILDRIIRNILAGKIKEKDKKQLIYIAESLRLLGVRGIVLGCTELPLIFSPDYSIPVYNSVAILSMALLRKYYE
jgi:aspartate racemase